MTTHRDPSEWNEELKGRVRAFQRATHPEPERGIGDVRFLMSVVSSTSVTKRRPEYGYSAISRIIIKSRQEARKSLGVPLRVEILRSVGAGQRFQSTLTHIDPAIPGELSLMACGPRGDFTCQNSTPRRGPSISYFSIDESTNRSGWKAATRVLRFSRISTNLWPLLSESTDPEGGATYR